MSPDPLSPIAPLSSATATLRALPLPEDRAVAAQAQTQTGQAGQAQATAPTPEVQASATPPPTSPPRDPVAQAVIDSRETAAARQTSLAPLFADLGEAAARRPATAALPADVRAAVDQVLAQRLPTQNGVTAQTLRDAVARSGLFLEANLAAGQTAPDPTRDLKAALLTLRQTLAAAQLALVGGEPAAPAVQIPPTTPAPAQATPGQASVQAPTLAPTQAAQSTTPRPAPAAPPPATAQPAVSPVAVSQASLLLAAQTAATPETADILIDQAIQTAQRAQQKTDVQTQVEALRQTAEAAVAAADADAAARPATAQASQGAAGETASALVQTPAQAAAQNALALAQQAAAQAAQLAAGSVNAQRTINQSSLLLAAQAAAIKPEDDEPSPVAPRLATAQETPAPVEAVSPTTPPPPVRGSTLAGQPPSPSTLPTLSGEAAIVRHLAEQVDHALARQALHQLASIPGGAPAEGAATASWMFEIPIATPQGTTIAQFEIDRDGQGQGAEAGGAATWRARFSLNFEPLGPVHVQLSQAGPRTAVNLWAEREGSLEALQAQSADLARDLGGEVRLQAGAPRRIAPSRGQFVDRLT